MRKNLQLIALLRSLATGMIAPVLTLMALSHGATIVTLSLANSFYAFTVIAAEFPSGVFADLFGRKRSFVISSVFVLLSYMLFLFSHSFLMLIFAMVSFGLGRAFASGSIDALAIDETSTDEELVKVTSRLAVLESVGLSVGSLAGGFLAGIGSAYAGNLLACTAVIGVMLLITLFTVHERSPRDRRKEERPRLRTHLSENFRFIKRRGIVRILIVFSILSGLGMMAVETYWQPAINGYGAAPWMLGVINFVGFGMVIVGSKLNEWFLTRKPSSSKALMLVQRALWGGSMFGMWLSGGKTTFVGSYSLGYLFLGGASVAESTMLNREAPSAQRASILSMFSFLLQIGGLLGSLGSYWIVMGLGYRAIWPIMGTLIIASALGFTVRTFLQKKRT